MLEFVSRIMNPMRKGCSSALKLLSTGALVCFAGMFLVSGLRAQGVLTWHNDAARTGQNLEETLLSPANVNSTNFGLLHNLALDGKVDAQPLYVPAVSIAGGTHNVLYVVTENDTVYAFDADSGTELWTPKSMIPSGETVSNSDNSCGQIGPEVGITSTPAIDLTQGPNGTIYLVAMTQNGSSYYHRLHALDLVSGNEQSGWPITITASTFVPKQYKERAGLLISHGVIYTTWASNCDDTPYNSWIMGYNESTRAQVVLNMTPNGSQGGIWMSGAGPAADAGGNVYFLIGNGTFDTTLNANGFPDEGDYGNAFMNISTTNGLTVADYFTMDNTTSESGSDEDLGSGGAMLLPVLNDAMGNPHELAVGAGKDGNAYVVDRNNMGKYNGSSNAVYQEFALPCGSPANCVFSSPAWFNNTLYYGANGAQLSAYPYSAGLMFGSGSPGTPSSQSSVSFTNATPSISANGTTNGIVWAVNTGSPAVLYAYNAANLATELYDSNQAASNRDHFGTGITFTTPTVANGKVFVGTTTGVAIFGITNCTYAVPGALPISAAGASGEIEIPTTPTTGCPFSATTTAEFIALSPVANGQVPYVISANPGAARVGTILIAGHVLTITQAGSDTLVPAPSNPSPANGSSGVSISPTLTWSASTGATSYDVYFGTSSTPSLVTNTASTSYTPTGPLVPGLTYYWMVVAKGSTGNANNSAIWSFITTNAIAVSDSPSSGTGLNQSFTLAFADTAGAASLQWVWVWFNATLAGSASNSCMLYYDITTNQVELLNDGGTAWLIGTPGTASTTLQNSQCSLNVTTTTVTKNGSNLTLSLPMMFQTSFAGAKNIYMFAGDISGTSSGWQQEGTWTVPHAAGTPTTVSVTPSSGSANSQAFALQYSDTAGWANLQSVWVWFNATFANSAASSCMLYYLPSTNQVELLNDAGTAWTLSTPGQPTTLQNSQCSLNVATTTLSMSGNNLTLNLAMTFKPVYAGVKNVYMYAGDLGGANSGWQQRGSWTVTSGAGVPGVVSVTPSSGSGGIQTFALQYSDTAGAPNLQSVWVWFSATFAGSGANSCMLYYNVATNQVELLNNAGTAWTVATPGAAGTLQNSQCSLNAPTTSVTMNGSTLTLNLAMTFQTAYSGEKNVYMYAADLSGANSGWLQPGSWTVPSTATASALSATPNSGTGLSQTFVLQYSDTAGASSIPTAWVWFNATFAGSAANSCMLYYSVATNQVELLNDAGEAWTVATPGAAATTLQNSQCSLNVTATSVSLSGSALTLNLAMTFQASYSGAKNIYIYAADQSGSTGGWLQAGGWTP
jgi:hypothetical protein